MKTPVNLNENNSTETSFLHNYFIKKSINHDDLQPIKDHITQKDAHIKRLLFCVNNQPAGHELISDQKIFQNGRNNKTAGRGTSVSTGYTPIGFDNAHLKSLTGDFVVCAGLADGIRVHQALECPVACCIGEGSIISIANQIHEDNPDLNIIITADNDTAGRRVLDRAPEWANLRMVSSAKDPSDVAQESGIDALRDELQKPRIAPTVFKFIPTKSQANINGCNISQAYMRLNKATEPDEAAKIAFLIMAKEALKCPHIKNLNDVQSFLYKKSAPFLLNWESLEHFKIFFERQINKRRKTILRQASLSHSVKSRHDFIEVQKGYTISPKDFNDHNVICLNWGMGSGKTQRGGVPFAAMADAEGAHFLATCHRKSLIDELCARLGTNDDPVYHYFDIKQEIVDIVKRSAFCLPSTTKLELQRLVEKTKYIFIDELDQTVKFLASPVCSTETATPKMVHDTLVKLIKNAKKVLAADAHLSNISLNFLENCRPHERFKILTMPYNSGLNVEFMEDKKPNVYGKMAAMLIAGERLWISCEGAQRATEVKNFISTINQRKLKVLCVNSDNGGDSNQSAFLSNPQQESLKYDAVIHSPVIGSGISIEHSNPHFTHGFMIGSGHSIQCTDAAQMMKRVRYLKNFTVCLGVNNDNKIENWEALATGLEAAANLEGVGVSGSHYDELVLNIKISRAILTNDFGAGLYWIIKHDGANIVSFNGDTSPIEDDIVKFVSETTKQDLIQGILNADDISPDRRSEIESLERRTTEQSMQIIKSRIRSGMGLSNETELTADNIEQWDSGRIISKIKRFGACFMRQYDADTVVKTTQPITEKVNDSEWSEFEPTYQQKSDVSSMALSKAKAVAYKNLFDGFDLMSKEFYICNDNAQIIIKRAILNDASRYMLACLGILPTKYAEYVPAYKTDRRGEIILKDGKQVPSGKTFRPPSNPKSEVKKIIESMGLKFNPRSKRKSIGENVWTINAESISEMIWLNAQRNSQRYIKTID